MVYENLHFAKPNMTIKDNYFFMFDEDNGVLWQKLQDGDTAFVYPLDMPLDTTVISLEYDGLFFWTLEQISGDLYIKQWRLQNFLCRQLHKYYFSGLQADAFTIESYNSLLTSSVVSGSNTIYIEDDFSSTIVSGAKVCISNDFYYEVNSVVNVSGTKITLSSGVTYTYDIGDNFYYGKNILVLLNQELYKYPIDGTSTSGVSVVYGDFVNISASTFTKIIGIGAPTYLLVYVRDTNLKFLDIGTMTLEAVATIDNIKTDNSTIIKIYDLAIGRDSVYRLQKEANYYEHDYSWSDYNYVLSTSRRFVDTTNVSAYPIILPANAVNVTKISVVVNDQYGDGVVNKPVFVTDDDPVGFITTPLVYTDYFFGTGEAVTYYKAGTSVRTVTIEGRATQFD